MSLLVPRNRRRIRGLESILDKVYEIAQAEIGPAQENNEPNLTLPMREDFLTSQSTSSVLSRSYESPNSSISIHDSPVFSSQESVDSYQHSYQSISSNSDSIADQEEITIDTQSGLGILYVISKVFQLCNLNELTQKRIYELINLISEREIKLISYKEFKLIMESIAEITTYKLVYCFNHREIIPFTNLCCSQKNLGHLAIFSFLDTITFLIEKNHGYLHSNLTRFESDICATSFYARIWQNIGVQDDVIRLTLMVNVDDAQMIKSSKVCTTPIPFIVAELPRHIRFAKRNVYNFGIYHGPKNIPTDLLWKKMVVEPLESLGILTRNLETNKLEYSCGFIRINTKVGPCKVIVRIGCIIMDTVAKAKNLNIKMFNGYYGCPYCLIEGTRVPISEGSSSYVMTYPFDEEEYNPLKTNEFYNCASRRACQHNATYFGIKGETILSELVSIPEQVPIDYMHCVLEGVFKLLFTLNPFKLPRVVEYLDKQITRIKLPHDLGRKFRKVSEIAYWKASECRLFLFNLVPLLRDVIPADSFFLMISLASAVKALCQPKLNQYTLLQVNEILISFSSEFNAIYGDVKMRFNIHLLTHLVKQYQEMGSLVDTSAFTYENNIYSLKRSFHGTRGHLNQMAVRYVLSKGLENDQVTERWISYYDPSNKLKFKPKNNGLSAPCGEIDNSFVLSNQIRRFLSRTFDLTTIKIFHRYKYNHEIFHSYNYKRKLNSVSYMISYLDHRSEQKFGRISCFLKAKKLNDHEGQYYGLVLVQEFKIMTRQNILSGINSDSPRLRAVTNLAPIQNYSSLITCKEKYEIIDVNSIKCKIILIPDKNRNGYFFATECNLPFDHD